jgi:hypothetical protein
VYINYFQPVMVLIEKERNGANPSSAVSPPRP